MRKVDFVFIDTPLTKCLISLCQEYYVQIQSCPACQNVKNRDAVRGNDLRKDHKPQAHFRHSTRRSFNSMIIRSDAAAPPARLTRTPMTFSHWVPASASVERYQSTNFRRPCSMDVCGE